MQISRVTARRRSASAQVYSGHMQAERSELLEAFSQASAKERRLMERTMGKPPGHPEHDPVLWNELLAAMNATHLAKLALRKRQSE
jgi:hypothetical protein